ncbi:hypothetical protein DV738_g1870, partial [Chaetothyriales sp. CBS 135597]
MSVPVEALSLSALSGLLAYPPQYPRNPTHPTHERLVLYIVRVPGSQDVFLTPLKPPTKASISLEAIQNSLYYFHVETAEDDTVRQSLEAEHHHLEQQKRPAPPILRKPLPPTRFSNDPTSRRPLSPPKSWPQYQSTEAAGDGSQLDRSTSRGSQQRLNLAGTDTGTGKVPRKPVGPRPLQSQLRSGQDQFGLSPPAARPEGKTDRLEPWKPQLPLPEQDGPHCVPNSPPRQDSERLSDDSTTITLIRRDPTSGAQWNVGSLRVTRRKSSMELLQPVDVVLTSPGYSKFVRNPDSPFGVGHGEDTTGGSIPDASTPVSPLSAPVFKRRLGFRPLPNDQKPSVQHVRTGSFDILADMSNGTTKKVPQVFAFTSPWRGICTFSNGVDGRTLKCRHTLPMLSSQQEGVAMLVAELRFNLPWSVLYHADVGRMKDSEADTLPISQLLSRSTKQQWRRTLQGFKQHARNSSKDDDAHRLSLKLGREKAGGGFKGNSAKLGKLIIEDEGLKMCDLVVASCMGPRLEEQANPSRRGPDADGQWADTNGGTDASTPMMRSGSTSASRSQSTGKPGAARDQSPKLVSTQATTATADVDTPTTSTTANGVPPPAAAKKAVQFSPPANAHDPVEVDGQDKTTSTGDRADSTKPSLYSKLMALASSQGFPSRSAAAAARSTDAAEPVSASSSRHHEGAGTALSAVVDETESDAADADVEESAAESDPGRSRLNTPARRRRRRGRRFHNDAETASPSPHSPLRASVQSARRNYQPDIPERIVPRPVPVSDHSHERSHVSEDEGRKMLAAGSAWKPRHPLRGLSYGSQQKSSESADGREPRRPLALRTMAAANTGSNLSHASAHDSDAADTPRASRRRLLAERSTTLGAQKWRQLKQKFNLRSTGRRKERTPDQEKSAELLAELAAGSPAALMLASMFQRDEHGQRRIPVLLEQVKVKVTDSIVDDSTPGDRHLLFKIELEYGNGINRMRWQIHRSLKDFVTLHAKYKLHFQSEKLKGRGESSKQMPKFPKAAFPVLKKYGVKALEDEDDAPDNDEAEQTGRDTDTDRPRARPGPQGHGLVHARTRSSFGNRDDGLGPPSGRDERRVRERERKKVEAYLQAMIKFMLFRPDSNRLCKFLEISALGMRLASEGSYHGKEGYLVLRSGKGVDFRKALTPSDFKLRHTPKWWLVRHSYVVCVDSPEEMHIYDELALAAKENATRNHRLKLSNSERTLKLLARNERMLHQFEDSIKKMIATSPWTDENRFGSFAPVRPNCFAQWLVDGRDYMWVLSRALNQAKDVIYIHDWWLSPELYLRRPPAISQKWRLDRILKRKAEEGVKVFVIVYRNIESAIPIDSQYTKFSLLDLHPNIFVQRSPNQFRQNTFFWAHHEKICIVDHTLAFVGGIDLCFGRWDTPQHTLIDDKPTGFASAAEPKDADHCQLWPGKDYSNPRIQDFYALNKPYEEMYDRSKIPRMPWHDIGMQVVGQPARDLTRHFVQRWNYILRQRKPTRPTPFLLPPPDFNTADLEALGLDGTCEVQILRSAGPWSLGTPDKTEHSIMNAYIKLIEQSDHFVYIENQFYISSCQTEGAVVHNKISDALVERILRAARNDEHWRAVIIIPLIPGFQNTVEEEGGTSVRLIMQYQYRSICRGESSIFGRLRSNGIDPDHYIQFYSLRQWGRVGPKNALVTEQLYIHAKIMVVDDRAAIIGSANINERSMLGNRDSECAAVVRDTDMLWSRMDRKPYRVGRFAHTLRMRLMREHLGLDVDKIMEEAQAMQNQRFQSEGRVPHPARAVSPTSEDEDDARFPISLEQPDTPPAQRNQELREELFARQEELKSFNHDVDWEQDNNPNLKSNRKLTEDPRVTGTSQHKDDVEGFGYDRMAAINAAGLGSARDTLVIRNDKEVLTSSLHTEGRNSLDHPRQHGGGGPVRLPSYVVELEAANPPLPPRPGIERVDSMQLGLPMLSQLPPLPAEDDTDIGGPALGNKSPKSANQRHPLLNELNCPDLHGDCMQDPLDPAFLEDIWHLVAENNTKIYRSVFRCMPDNQVRDWTQYHEYVAYEQRFNQLQGNDTTNAAPPAAESLNSMHRTGPPGAGSPLSPSHIIGLTKLPSAKNGVDVRGKIAHLVSGEPEAGNADQEKEDLRKWAAEANAAQVEKQGRPLHRQGTLLDEKDTLKGIPEEGPTSQQQQHGLTNGIGHQVDGNTDEASSSPTTIRPGTANATPMANVNGITNTSSNDLNEKTAELFPSVSLPATNPAEGGNRARGTSITNGTGKKRRRGTTRSSRRDFSASDDILSIDEAEELLALVQGHLVLWPYDWLERVEAGSNWLFPFDQISPIEIYL